MILPNLLKAPGRHRVFFIAILISVTVLAAGPARAELDFGFKAHYGDDFAVALEELQPLAEAGDARAQLWLGLMYYYGRGVSWNPRLASWWIDKSAQQLYFDAEFARCFFIYGCFIGGNPTP